MPDEKPRITINELGRCPECGSSSWSWRYESADQTETNAYCFKCGYAQPIKSQEIRRA